jgi:hypothetical protein
MQDSNRPLFSVVVVIVSDTTEGRADTSHLRPCIQSLGRQKDAPPMEIIVPYYDGTSGIAVLRHEFPHVQFLRADSLRHFTPGGKGREHHDELRARGLAHAKGDIIALLEDHAIVDCGWSAAMVKAHRGEYAGIGGPIENGVGKPLNWAVYFCDFARYQGPLPEAETLFASDANVSYKRTALEPLREIWGEVFREPEVNGALQQRGQKLAFAPAIVYHHRQLQLSMAVSERYIWGRSYGAARSKLIALPKRLVLAALSPLLPALMLLRMSLTALRKRRTLGAFVRAFPLTAVLAASWAWGELAGYVTGKPCPLPAEKHRSDERAPKMAQ